MNTGFLFRFVLLLKLICTPQDILAIKTTREVTRKFHPRPISGICDAGKRDSGTKIWSQIFSAFPLAKSRSQTRQFSLRLSLDDDTRILRFLSLSLRSFAVVSFVCPSQNYYYYYYNPAENSPQRNSPFRSSRINCSTLFTIIRGVSPLLSTHGWFRS